MTLSDAPKDAPIPPPAEPVPMPPIAEEKTPSTRSDERPQSASTSMMGDAVPPVQDPVFRPASQSNRAEIITPSQAADIISVSSILYRLYILTVTIRASWRKMEVRRRFSILLKNSLTKIRRA